MKNEDVEFLRNFSIDVVSSNKHNKEDAAKLLSDVNTFTTEWKEFKDVLQTNLLRYAYVQCICLMLSIYILYLEVDSNYHEVLLSVYICQKIDPREKVGRFY